MKEKLSIVLNTIELTQSEYCDLINSLNVRISHFQEFVDSSNVKSQTDFFKKCISVTSSVLEKIKNAVTERLDMFTFQPGDVVSQYPDDRNAVCVDKIVDCAAYSDLTNGQTEAMYAVSHSGIGLTDLDPRNFHLVSEEARIKFFEKLKEYNIIYENGIFKSIYEKENE